MSRNKIYFPVVAGSIMVLSSIGFWVQSSLCDVVFMWEPFSSQIMDLGWALVFDQKTFLFLFIVLLISTMVLSYSNFYMPSERGVEFLFSLLLFVVSMVILSSSGSLFWSMIGWDGLGLTSFLLILFFKTWDSLKSSLETFLTNRLGDAFILLSLGALLSSGKMSFTLSLLLVLGAFSKSAQIPFVGWLPKAMAAPTPVSCLVHSSTLVTAGVYILIRYHSLVSEVNKLGLIVGTLSLIYAGFSALKEWDLKKIIALSTLSHISFMIILIMSGMINAALFHMACHALFKSFLFMVSGVIIHGLEDQDLRHTLIPSKMDPFLFSLFGGAFMSMVGIPAMSGFFSKEMALSISQGIMPLPIWLEVGVFLTAAYSGRTVFFLFKKSILPPMSSSTSQDWKGSVLFASLFLSTLGGSVLSWMISTHSLEESLETDSFWKWVTIGSLMVGLVLGFIYPPKEKKIVGSCPSFISMIWQLTAKGSSFIDIGGGLPKYISFTTEFSNHLSSSLGDMTGLIFIPIKSALVLIALVILI